jgi:hypothetical protein
VANVVMANRIILSLFAPNFEGYDRLSQIDKSEWEVVEYEGCPRRRHCRSSRPIPPLPQHAEAAGGERIEVGRDGRALSHDGTRARRGEEAEGRRRDPGLPGHEGLRARGDGHLLRGRGSGRTAIFLKQYKSPAPTVVWYRRSSTISRSSPPRSRRQGGALCGRLVDAFEERWGGPCYFQAYEFVEHGGDLQQMLDDERETHRRTGVSPLREPDVWARHVTWAKVLMAGIAALHESRIVHADLKPPNVYLIRDPSLARLPAQADRHGLLGARGPSGAVARLPGYVGSDNYRSPEHLTRGAMPGLASDVFTCGLILYELLAGTAPVLARRQAEYASAVRAYAAKPPVLAGQMPGPATNAEVSPSCTDAWRLTRLTVRRPPSCGRR